MSIRQSTGAFFDAMVVVTMMTTLGLIVGILALAIAYSGTATVSRKVMVSCFIIGLVGLVTIALQVRAITNRKHLCDKLTTLYLEGREVINRNAANPTPENGEREAEWKQRVLAFLSKEMESSHVMRFETADLRVLAS